MKSYYSTLLLTIFVLFLTCSSKKARVNHNRSVTSFTSKALLKYSSMIKSSSEDHEPYKSLFSQKDYNIKNPKNKLKMIVTFTKAVLAEFQFNDSQIKTMTTKTDGVDQSTFINLMKVYADVVKKDDKNMKELQDSIVKIFKLTDKNDYLSKFIKKNREKVMVFLKAHIGLKKMKKK